MKKKAQQPKQPGELLILRHGKSDWSTGDTDFDRPLKDRGKRSAQKIGNWLAEQNLQPDIIISSPAERANTTAEKACKSMGHDTSIIQTNESIYEASLNDLLAVLSEIPDTVKRVMLVGHNPGLEDLLVYLAKEVTLPDDGKILPTATLAYLKVTQPWHRLKAGKAILYSVTRPAFLPKKFPFPTSSGIEYRIRPTYYYSQSAIIPYRIADEQLEILLITSSSNKHWIVPKGIIEPGLTAVQSAEKEALEEAGIEGVSNNKKLGCYTYDKWKAQCTVEVFSMQVNHILPKSQWHESYRKRQWVSVGAAKKMVKQTALIPLFDQLQQQVK